MISPGENDEAFTYDTVGNRLTSAEHAGWTYNANNELVSCDGVTYEYDANGNMVKKDRWRCGHKFRLQHRKPAGGGLERAMPVPGLLS